MPKAIAKTPQFLHFLGIKPPINLPPEERKQWRATMQAEAKRMAALGYPETTKEKPPRFPMKFREFLRRMFGGRLHSERLHLYRKYLYNSFQVSEYFQGGHASAAARNSAADQKRDALIAKQNIEGIKDPHSYAVVKEDIIKWRKENRIFQRKNAAKNRWLKENRKKLLAVLCRRISDISQSKECRFAKPKPKKSAGSHPKR
jgi:hypothetical protein